MIACLLGVTKYTDASPPYPTPLPELGSDFIFAFKVPKASSSAEQFDDVFDDTDVDMIEACETESNKVWKVETNIETSELESCSQVDNDTYTKDDTDSSAKDGGDTSNKIDSDKDCIDSRNECKVGTSDKDEIIVSSQVDADTQRTDSLRERICPGHERALPIEQTVIELDVKEEGRFISLLFL